MEMFHSKSHKTKITVNGSIINELSEKIPSNIVAINELIKNSYDAFATDFKINFDLENKKLLIIDNGNGMSKENIDELFHLSHSTKVYGTIVNGRYVQGSKGLGFLAIFRFGNVVTWKTSTDGKNGFKFILNRDELLSQTDISNFPIQIENDSSISKGTTIEVDMNGVNLELIKNDLENHVLTSKIVNSFCDKKMTITLQVGKRKYTSNQIKNINDINPDSQIFKIRFFSIGDIKSCIAFFVSNKTGRYKAFEVPLPPNIEFKDFSVKIELMAHNLKYSSTKRFPELFWNPTKNKPELTPLLFINNNLFNNYNLFDVNINRGLQNNLTLPNIIGSIKIYSSSPDMIFNSDRTQFSQNQLTNNIATFLKTINTTIQKIGSERKKHLDTFDFLNNVPILIKKNSSDEEIKRQVVDNIAKDFFFKAQTEIIINKEKSSVRYRIFGHTRDIELKLQESEKLEPNTKGPSPVKAKPLIKGTPIKKKKINGITPILELTSETEFFDLYNNPIDLQTFVKKATYSDGSMVALTDITIEIDGNLQTIIQSIETPTTKNVFFSFTDKSTNILVKRKLEISFHEKKSGINGAKTRNSDLITYPGKKGYTVNFHPIICSLTNEINTLYKIGNYNEVIACSLRSLYDLSIDALKTTNDNGNISDFNAFQTKLLNSGDLEANVSNTVNFFIKDKSRLTTLAQNASTSNNELKGILIPDKYKDSVKSAHLGAHKSTKVITTKDIEDLGTKTGTFLVMVNELLKII